MCRFQFTIFSVSIGLAIACGEPDAALSQTPPGAADSTIFAIPTSADPAARAAAGFLAAGRPFRATQELALALRDSTRRHPEVVLTAAIAASRWGGWGRVHALLVEEPWLDLLFGGHGRALLAQAALERNADTAALAYAEAAVQSASGDRARGERLVLLARALDRLQHQDSTLRDSARVAYERAAVDLPELADWLCLRAAALASNSTARAVRYAALETPVARARAPWTEATARERQRDVPGAIRAFEALGERSSVLRLRLVAAADSVAQAAVRRELITLVASQSGTAEARTAVEVLDAFSRLTPEDELTVARSVAASGPLDRAAMGFARALGAGLGGPADQFSYGTVLARLGRHREAAGQLARIRTPAPLAAAAAYQRARSLLSLGDGVRTRVVLRKVLGAYSRDTSAAAALNLLADLAVDDGRDAAARSAYLELAREYPQSGRAPFARFKAAIIAYASGAGQGVAAEFDSLRARYPRADEWLAATYWSGRAWARAGDSGKAHQRWRAVVARDPLSYYSAASAKRLGEEPWVPPAAADSFVTVDEVERAMERADLLERLGMATEARWEYDRLAADATASVDRLLATARAFSLRGMTSRAIPLAQRALAVGVPGDARVYRLVYPISHRVVLSASADEHRIDPALAAALIRQESSFNPRATSRVGARGLMQVMPATGELLARRIGLSEWDAVLLYQPDVNMQLGVVHLAGLLARYPDLVRALAAYNAGASRVQRWSARAGVEDPELFAERIPFVETRDYVRIIQRNRDLYRALYAW